MKNVVWLFVAVAFSCSPRPSSESNAVSRARAMELLRAAEPTRGEIESVVAQSVSSVKAAPASRVSVVETKYLNVEKRSENLPVGDDVVDQGDEASIDYDFVYAVTKGTESVSYTGTVRAGFTFDGEKFVRVAMAVSDTAYGVNDVMTGRVTACGTGAPVFKAAIRIAFRDGHEKSVFTAEDGTYVIRAVKGEQIVVSASAAGYDRETVETFVPDQVDFELCAASAPLPETDPAQTIVHIAGGGLHACAIAADATVRCWGRNNEGQLGNATFLSSSSPVTVAGLGNVVELSAGIYHTCARTSSGAAFCWGLNAYGQLGDGTLVNRNTPVAVSGLGADVKQVEAGFHFSCALLASSGAVRCWGINNHGQLGNGTYAASGGSSLATTVINVDGSQLTGVEAIDGGGAHACALKQGGLVCWGSTGYGNNALGFETGPDTCNSPYQTEQLYCAKRAYSSEATSGVVDFMTAQYATCVLRQSGQVTCWGDNRGYQLGTDMPEAVCVSPIDGEGSFACSRHGLSVEGPGNTVYTELRSFATGSPIFFGCGGDAAGDVACWGAIDMTAWAQETAGTPHAKSMAGAIPKLSGLAAGAYHVCGSTTAGAVFCWGNNSAGQLGMAAGAVSTAVRVPGF